MTVCKPIQSLRGAFSQRLGLSEQMLKAQSEANAELANRMRDLETLTKIRIQKDAEYMETLHDQLRHEHAKTAGLLQTVQVESFCIS